jgi:hypothetical protein
LSADKTMGLADISRAIIDKDNLPYLGVVFMIEF